MQTKEDPWLSFGFQNEVLKEIGHYMIGTRIPYCEHLHLRIYLLEGWSFTYENRDRDQIE